MWKAFKTQVKKKRRALPLDLAFKLEDAETEAAEAMAKRDAARAEVMRWMERNGVDVSFAGTLHISLVKGRTVYRLQGTALKKKLPEIWEQFSIARKQENYLSIKNEASRKL